MPLWELMESPNVRINNATVAEVEVSTFFVQSWWRNTHPATTPRTRITSIVNISQFAALYAP